MPSFILAIFLSAFLLFQVQPIIARYILPWYGGSPAVWTTCMLFFQVGLLLGYTYAHLLVSRFRERPRWQAGIHLGLLVLSVLVLPITPSESLKPGGAEGSPVLGIDRSAGNPLDRRLLQPAAGDRVGVSGRRGPSSPLTRRPGTQIPNNFKLASTSPSRPRPVIPVFRPPAGISS